MSRPQDKHLIPLTERSVEEAHAIRSSGGKAVLEQRKKRTEQQYLLGKYAGTPILDKRTVKKFERMGFEDEEINRALEITDSDFVSYPSGHRDRIDVAVRRAVLTGVNQTTAKLTEMNAEDLDADYYEVTAHAGARPSHAEWQGKVYKIHGSAPGYPNFADATGYGTGDGLCGWNCRHSFFPFFPGISARAYSEDVLKSFNEASYEYDGVKMTEYEVSQNMRAMERSIRETKRELAGYNAAIEETNDPELKAKLQDEFNAQSVKLKKREAKYKDFCSKTDHRPDSVRTGVAAVKGKNGKIIGWNQSTAQKSFWANKRVENEKLDVIINSGNVSGAITDPESKRAKKHAANYYGLVRTMSSDVSRIAKNTGFSEHEIGEIKKHIFLEKHDLGEAEPQYFAPDFAMAQSWQRLINGNPEPHDITLLKHEQMERRLMQSGLTQDEAHSLASQQFNYRIEVEEYYDKIKERQKRRKHS